MTERPPSILIPPVNRTVELGDTASFRCNTSGDPVPDVTWLKNGIDIKGESTRYVIVVHSRTLYIRNVEWLDVAPYTCVARNIHGTQKAVAYLNVKAGTK